jgi:uncharacterized protein YbjT (DUF2867 family)
MSLDVLVLGASGYVGGRLVPRLLGAGHRVRCLARSPQKLQGMPWAPDVEIVRGDLLDRDDILPAFAGMDAVYHLVHSMGSQDDFAYADRTIARHVARAAEVAHLRRIVYLGGLGEVDAHTSEHLRSRAEVGEILLDASVPTTVLRAAVIIGSGSASFEMIRHLVEKLPVMITPRWVNTRTQPIAIRDVLRYLVGVLDDDSGREHVFDIGGPDVMNYLDMMAGYAQAADLPKRLVVKVPVLTPRLSSGWVNLFTPVPYDLARPLIDSLANEVVVRRDGERIEDLVPGATIPYPEALRLALARIKDHEVETSWRDADLAGRSPAEPYPGDPDWTGGTLLRDVREMHARALPRHVFAAVSRIGGERGWPSYTWAWKWRGRLDRLMGGVGLGRGRRDPERLRVGDALDFWRVEELRQGGSDGEWVIRLRAEFWAPGHAWLEFRIVEDGEGSAITQRALYAPKGLLGRLYWWILLPIHPSIFTTMIAAIAADAEDIARTRPHADVVTDVTSSDAPTGPPSHHDEADAEPDPTGPPARRAG